MKLARSMFYEASPGQSPAGVDRRNGAPFKAWVLPNAMAQVRRRLSAAEVEAACVEALREGVHSADVVLNIPGPPRPGGGD
jgi:hypothetical protein